MFTLSNLFDATGSRRQTTREEDWKLQFNLNLCGMKSLPNFSSPLPTYRVLLIYKFLFSQLYELIQCTLTKLITWRRGENRRLKRRKTFFKGYFFSINKLKCKGFSVSVSLEKHLNDTNKIKFRSCSSLFSSIQLHLMYISSRNFYEKKIEKSN